MPNLDEILKKTKSKSEKVSIVRKPILIAADDRPYSINNDMPHSSTIINIENKLNTNQTQTKHKVDTNLTQTNHIELDKNTYQTQSTHKLHTKLNTSKTQSTHKVDTNQAQTEHISTLIGHQRNILLYLFEACKKSSFRITEPLSIIHIRDAIEMPLGSVKTSILRLCQKGFIRINNFKNGRGGWTVYEIPDHFYKELLQMETQHKLNTKYTQTSDKLHTKLNTQPNTNVSSSSRYINNNITTTDEEEILNLDLTPYENIGFRVTHIKQALSSGVSLADIEQALDEFKYDYENNLINVKKTPIHVLMKEFRRGRVYSSKHYLDAERSAHKLIADNLREKAEMKLMDDLVIWEASLSEDDKNKMIKEMPTTLMAIYKSTGLKFADVREWVLIYYRTIIEKECST